ncbi:hypothetical protein vseg_002887 [Gypsophila vaccaria]
MLRGSRPFGKYCTARMFEDLLHLIFCTLNRLTKHRPELLKVTDQKGWRHLSYAANRGYLDEVACLLTNFPESAGVHDKDGSLPMHKGASVSYNRDIFSYLTKELKLDDSFLNLKDNEVKTFMDYAKELKD